MGCEGGLGCLRGSSSFSCVCLSFTFFGVGVAWSQVGGPSCDSWVLDSSDARLRRPDAPSPFVAVDSSLGVCSDLG